MSNKPYREKKDFYKNSNASFTREVSGTYNKSVKKLLLTGVKS